MNQMKQEKKEPVGLECRNCGCRHFSVEGTRIANKQIIRYRICKNCGQRMTTREHAIT